MRAWDEERAYVEVLKEDLKGLGLGAESVSAVLIGADKGDETLGFQATRAADPAGPSWGDASS